MPDARAPDGGVTRLRAWWGRNWRRLGVIGLVVLVVAAAGVGWYVATPFRATPGSLDAVRANDAVTVSQASGTYVLSPTAPATSRVGLVFYPGGNVHPDAYLPSLAPLAADANVTVFVPSVRLTLAVFDQNAATPVIESHPDIDRWYVGGHSLGGAMACRYAAANADRVEGLVLFAAYCDRNLADSDLRVLSVTGSADTVLNRERYRESRANLPADATVVELDGVNHTQFGAYTGQRGDEPSGTSYATAHDRLAGTVVPWFQRTNASRLVRPDRHRLVIPQ
ncbi:alpha/beta hydrolase [Halorarius litoreus]|uniref:alpha/beta hydrolase n=1 Tax=Halorarius litoreus TaxID=2962676 RepID=UPI0020CD33C5|nr:alpha/beta hydrolase [Halorarius litoreus]